MPIEFSREQCRIYKDELKKILNVGVPIALQETTVQISFLVVNSVINQMGLMPSAGYGIAQKIVSFIMLVPSSVMQSVSAFVAQNIGAGKLERVREGFRASHFIGIVYSVVVGSFLFFAGKYFAYLFISDNIEEVLPMVAIYVKCVALFFIPLYFVNVLRNGIQGMGYGLLPMMAGVAELAGRGITATIAAGKSSYIGTCLASPVAWIFASVLLWVMYVYVMKDMARKLYGTNKL